MRKYLAVFLVLVIVLSLGCVLVSCKPKEELPGEEPPAAVTKTVMEIFEAIGEQMPGGALSTDAGIQAKLGKNEYFIGFRMNNPTDLEDISKFEFVFDIRNGNRDGSVVFATYIVNSKVYIETLGGLKVYIADFDIDFIIDLVKQIPDVATVLDAILTKLPIEGIDLSTAGILDLLVPLLFGETYYTENEDGTTSIGAEIILSNFLESILGLISDVGLDNEIGKVLNMPFDPNTSTPLSDFLLNDVGGLVKAYPFKVMLNGTLTPGETPDINVDWKMANTGGNVVNVDVKVNVSETKQDLGIPTDLTTNFEQYSVFNLGMDLTISAEIGSEGNPYLDLTRLINLFAGQYESIIPDSVPLKLSLGEAGIKMSIQTQLNRYDNSENLMRIELDGGFIEDGTLPVPVLFGIYYIDSAFYIKINFNDSKNNGLFAPVIKFTGVDLAQILDSVLGGGEIIDGVFFEGLGKMISNAILGAIGSTADVNVEQSSYSAANSAGQTLTSSSFNADENSNNVIMPLIYKLLGIFGFDKKLLANDADGFGINFYNGSEDEGGKFIQDLLSLVPQIKDLLGDKAASADLIQNLIGSLRFNYGKANAGMSADKRELANITLDISTITGSTPIGLKLVADNFRFGAPDASLQSYIRGEIENVDVADNLSELIANIADGAKLSAGLDVKLQAGTIDLNALLAPIGIDGIPNLPNIVINEEINLKFRLELQFAFNAASPSSSKLKLELILASVTNGSGVSDPTLFPFMALGVPAIGLYSVDGSLYVDLSGIKIANLALPRLKADVDIMSMLADQLNNIDMNFTLNDIMNLIQNNTPEEEVQPANLQAKYSNDGGFQNIGGTIIITKDLIAVQITSMAIMEILQGFVDINFGLPNILLEISVGGDSLVALGATIKDDDYKDILSIKLYVEEFNIGLNDSDFNNSFTTFDPSLYESNIIDIAKDLLGHVDISAEVSMLTRGDKLDVTALINSLMAIAGERIDFPIVIDIANFNDKLNLVLKWNLADNPRDSELIFELFSENGKPTKANGYKATGLHIGFYVKDAELLLDLSQLGITKLKYVDFDVNALIDMILESALSGIGMDINNLDLTTILGDLLGSILPANAPETATFADNYTAAAYNASVTAVNIGDELINSLLDAVLNNLSINDGKILLSLVSTVLENGTISDPISDILYQLGIEAGMDIGLEAGIDIAAGEIALKLGMQNTELGLKLNINSIGKGSLIDWKNEQGNYWVTRDEIPELPEQFKFSTFADISSTSLFGVIINALANVTGENQPDPNWKYVATLSTRIKSNGNWANYQDLTIEIAKAYRQTSDSDMTFTKGDLKIVIFRTDSNGGSKATVAVVRFAIRESCIYLKLKEGIANTPILNLIQPIWIALPLNSLADSLPKFNIPTIGSSAKAKSLSSNVYAAAEEETFGIDTLFDSEHGINIVFGNNNDVKINVDVKGTFISNMLNELLGGLFNSSMDGVGNRPFNYLQMLNNGDHDNIVNNIYDNFLRPFIDAQIGANISGLLAAWSGQIKDVIRRVLPIPKFTDARIELNVIEGAASTAKIRAYASTADKDADKASNYTSDKHNIAIDLLNSVTSRRIDWMGQSTDIIYLMDGFGATEQEKLKSNFVKTVWKNVDNTAGSLNIMNYANINFNDSGYQKLHNALFSRETFATFINDPNNRVVANEDGTYTYEFDLVTERFYRDYNTDSGKVASLPVKITLMPYMDVKSIDTVYLSPIDKQPVGGNLSTDVVIRYGDGEKMTATKLIENIPTKAEGTVLPNGDVEVMGNIKFLDNTTDKGYVDKQVKVVYLSTETKKFVGEYNVFESQKATLQGILNSSTITAVSAESLKNISGIPKVAYFKYDSSPIWRSEVIASWDMTNVKNYLTTAGTSVYFTVNATATLKNGTKVEYNFNMVSDTVKGVSFNGAENTLFIDPLDYWNPTNWKRNQLTDALAYSKTENKVFLTEADVKYTDGRIVKETISWDAETLMNTFINNYEALDNYLTTRTYQGMIIRPVNTRWNNQDNQLTGISITILNRTNPSLVFGVNESGDEITALNMNPYDNVTALMDRTATAVYPDGKRIQVKMQKGADVILPINGGLVYAKANVLPVYYDSLRNGESLIEGEYIPKGSLIGTTQIPLIVEKCIVNDLASSAPYTLNTISRYLFKDVINNGVNRIVDLLPTTLTFNINEGATRSFDVEYSDYYKDEDESNFDSRLSEYNSHKAKTITVQLRLKNREAIAGAYTHQMQVVIPDRSIDNSVEQRTLTVTYEDYLTKIRHGVSNRVTINFGKGDNIYNDTLIINDNSLFDFNSIDLTANTDVKGYVNIKLSNEVTVRMPLVVSKCPAQVPIGLATGYDTIVFDKTAYFQNQSEGKEGLNYAAFDSWKLKVVDDGVLSTQTYTNIKWEYSNIRPNVQNQTVTLKVFDSGNNIVGIYNITIKFI